METEQLSKKEIKRRGKCEASYDVIAPKIGLNSTMTVNEQVQKLIYHADEIMTRICQNADLIKIDYFEQVQEITPIQKPQWMEFVKLAVDSTNGTITDKKMDKIQESFENSVYVTSLRMKFIDTFVKSSGSTKVEWPEKEQEIPLPVLAEFESNSDFEILLQKAVSTRTYLDKVLWPEYNEVSEAFQFITAYKYNQHQFKDLVDMWHYRHGGYPSENSAPKLWAKINSFAYITKLMRSFNLTQIEKELKRFGITITFDETNEKLLQNWSDVVFAFMDSKLYTIRNVEKENIAEIYPDLQLDSIILNYKDKWLAFAEDTREIYEIPNLKFPNSYPTLEYELDEYNKDSFAPLFLSENCSAEFTNYVNSNFAELFDEEYEQIDDYDEDEDEE